MSSDQAKHINRRALLSTAAAAGFGMAAAPALALDNSTEFEATGPVRNNISSFRMLDWQSYFTDTKNGAILVDTTSRALHFCSDDKSIYKLYPTSVTLTDDLTRRGRTEIVQKVVGPTWRPTPEMKIRNPEWPDFVPAGPENPLGTHALYLSWTYYRIHGTHDTRKIGRRSSNGCIGLYNEHIAELFGLTKIGTQVLLI
ncbi:L,D-transpeptidase [Pseudorhodobacter sp.]|uniref:L,D-transpeptidase n=1 Tax=Pseudorhodobacter sp. TaxID=1934400 RepID=UPI0026492F13|nr:L,D-transpeptidase [Pseudorhodobacter sp.]MDN5786117.1 L,D-transpeptidase [Pseudorhodobacter sp.]